MHTKEEGPQRHQHLVLEKGVFQTFLFVLSFFHGHFDLYRQEISLVEAPMHMVCAIGKVTITDGECVRRKQLWEWLSRYLPSQVTVATSG